MSKPNEEKWIPIAQAAKIADVAVTTMRGWGRTGKVKLRKRNNRLYIQRKSLMAVVRNFADAEAEAIPPVVPHSKNDRRNDNILARWKRRFGIEV